MKEYTAHITEDGRAVQTLSEHSENTASTAGQLLEGSGLGQAAYLAGLIHDMGKATDSFEAYIRGKSDYDTASDGKCVHSTASVRYMLEHFHEGKGSYRDLAAELIAIAAGSHHALFDLADRSGESGFTIKMREHGYSYSEASENFERTVSTAKELSDLFSMAAAETEAFFKRLVTSKASPLEMRMFSAFTARLITSAVIEGDRHDTAAFYGIYVTETTSTPDWKPIMENFEKELSSLPRSSDIDRIRQDIAEKAKDAAGIDSGMFTLNVPTGGGKTLSSMRFALHHAESTGKSRIIAVTPLLSVIDQNADVLGRYLPDGVMTEHHSNAAYGRNRGADLMRQNWHAPIIMTTLVRFLETCFSSSTSDVRRFHALKNAVIVFDEVQSVPLCMMKPFLMLMNYLTQALDTTILFSSATLTVLDGITPGLMKTPYEIVPAYISDLPVFRRTKTVILEGRKLSDMPSLIRELQKKHGSLLVIVNRRDEAAWLYREHSDMTGRAFHMSASMCQAHRKATMERISRSLDAGTPTLVISTQVMQTGCDISFPAVLRFAAGLSDLIQSAGRCNRHGESKTGGTVYSVFCCDEDLSRLSFMQKERNAFLALLSEGTDDDPSGDANRRRFQELLNMELGENYTECWLGDEKATLVSLLTSNRARVTEDSARFIMQQAFRSAGDAFRVFEEKETDMIVPYGKGREIIKELRLLKRNDRKELGRLIRKAAPYTVSVRSADMRDAEILAGGAALAPREDAYSPDTGYTRRKDR